MKRSNQVVIFLGFILSFSAISNAFVYQKRKPDGKWCVAKEGASEADLQSYIDYVCQQAEPRIDCSPISPPQPNCFECGSCLEPNTKHNHASFVLDSYYYATGACPHVNSIATVVDKDPSYGKCHFP